MKMYIYTKIPEIMIHYIFYYQIKIILLKMKIIYYIYVINGEVEIKIKAIM